MYTYADNYPVWQMHLNVSSELGDLGLANQEICSFSVRNILSPWSILWIGGHAGKGGPEVLG